MEKTGPVRVTVLFIWVLLSCAEAVRELPRETPREQPFTYRISLEDQMLHETPESKITLARVPAGAVVAETGPEGRVWLEDKGGTKWINVAYRGDVGWLPAGSTEKPTVLASLAAARDFSGTWVDSQICAGRPAFLRLEANGTFSGIRCEYCDLPGCPNGLYGTWTVHQNLVCMEEKRGDRACFFVWKNLLVALPERGFFWEYHGGAALSGLARQ